MNHYLLDSEINSPYWDYYYLSCDSNLESSISTGANSTPFYNINIHTDNFIIKEYDPEKGECFDDQDDLKSKDCNGKINKRGIKKLKNETNNKFIQNIEGKQDNDENKESSAECIKIDSKTRQFFKTTNPKKKIFDVEKGNDSEIIKRRNEIFNENKINRVSKNCDIICSIITHYFRRLTILINKKILQLEKLKSGENKTEFSSIYQKLKNPPQYFINKGIIRDKILALKYLQIYQIYITDFGKQLNKESKNKLNIIHNCKIISKYKEKIPLLKEKIWDNVKLFNSTSEYQNQIKELERKKSGNYIIKYKDFYKNNIENLENITINNPVIFDDFCRNWKFYEIDNVNFKIIEKLYNG